MSAAFHADRLLPSRVSAVSTSCVPVEPTYRRGVDGDTLSWFLEAECVQLVDPTFRELGAVLGDDLVGPGGGPGAPVPCLLELGSGFLVRVVGSPLGFVALDVVPDLSGPGAEGADVGSQLGDLTTGQIERVAVAGERGAEVRVAHDCGVSHAVDRAQAVADPDGVDPSPSACRPDAGVDLQVQVPVRVPGPRRVVPHDRRLDLLDRHLDLPTPRTDPGRRVLSDPADDLLSRSALRRVVGLSDLGMQGGGQRPRLRAVHRDLDEPHPLRVRPQPPLRLAGLDDMAGHPLLIRVPIERSGSSHDGRLVTHGWGRHVALRNSGPLCQVVVVGTRPIGLDIVPGSGRRSAIDLHATVHCDNRSLTTVKCRRNAETDRREGRSDLRNNVACVPSVVGL